MSTEQQETEIDLNEGQHLDEQVDGGDTSPQTPEPQPTSNELDWKLLYAQSVRERQERENELAQLRQQLTAPKPSAPQEEEITDADIERYGTTGVIKKIVAQTLRNELSNSLGDIREISGDFKKNKQIASAEEAFFSQFPHLAQYRDTLSKTIRGNLNNFQSVDSNIYATQAFATIGYYTAMNAANPNPATPPVNNAATPKPMAPTRNNGAPTPTRQAPRLSELERTGMKRIGLDPNKAEDVQEFLRIINNDEGVTV